MKLIQFHLPNMGKRVGIVTRDDEILDVTSEETPGVLEVLELAQTEGISIGVLLADIQERVSNPPAGPPLHPHQSGEPRDDKLRLSDLNVPPNPENPHLLLPLHPPEVWGCGVTYKRSADMRDEDSAQDIYSRVYNADRPEIFYKGTSPRCTGPNGFICIRSDSTLTATEPELAYVLGANREIVGYTICNDVSAWDIERENPLYLPQSKVFYGCCALGPMFVTPSEVDNPYELNVKCTVSRNEKLLYEGNVNTSQINWKFEELTEFLCRDNPVPIGTVISTGTGIIVPNDLPLAAGDVVQIEIDGLGVLSNPVKQL